MSIFAYCILKISYYFVDMTHSLYSIKIRSYMNYFKIMQCNANFIVIYHLEETLKGFQRTNYYIQVTYKISLRVFHFKT